jgi:hypothetical protein
MAAFIPRITTQYSPKSPDAAFYETMFCNRVNSVLRAGGLKTAIAVRKHVLKEAVVKRKGFLVNPYQNYGKLARVIFNQISHF